MCQPLFAHLNLKRFFRSKLILNEQGKCHSFQAAGTDEKSLAAYLFEFEDNGEAFTHAIRETPLDIYSYFLWPQGSKCPMLQLYRERFNLVKGLSIYKRYKTHIDAWCFATNGEANFPMSINEKTIAPFHEFMKYFAIQQNSVHNALVIKYSQQLDMACTMIQREADLNSLYKQGEPREPYSLVTAGQAVTFSPREWNCLVLHGQGRTYKEIAKALSISPRTVEHYIIHVKKKLGLHFKSELIDVI